MLKQCLCLQSKQIDAMAAHPGTAHTAIWDKMDKDKAEGVAFDLTAKVFTSPTIAVVLFGVNSLGSVCEHR